MSVIASSDEVIRNLRKYLAFRKFKNIQINLSQGEIIAERKNFIFGHNHIVSLKVQQVNEDTTNIEIIIDPDLKERSPHEEKLEEKLRDNLYDFI